jgi:transcriptional regulator with GAF, ATPase, and Fis domain
MIKRDGRFLLADKGTIFLDEVGELPLDVQAKLLRVIQEGEFQPVGSNRTIKVDIRLIAATNRDLAAEVKKGNFREDLYFRLNVFFISIPPLRERGNDIVILAESFLDRFSRKLGKKKILLTEKDKQRLLWYSWPGNIRELQNLMERGVITSSNGKLNIDSLLHENKSRTASDPANEKKSGSEKILSLDSIRELEKQTIIKALEQCNWKISGPNGAAKVLNIPTSTLTSKIKAFAINRRD